MQEQLQIVTFIDSDKNIDKYLKLSEQKKVKICKQSYLKLLLITKK